MTRPALDVVKVTVPSHPKHLPLVRALAEQSAAGAGFAAEERQQIALGVTEGVTNVMRHGYDGDTRQRIDLVLDTRPGVFRIEVHDHGRFVDPDGIRSRPLDQIRPGGLGVHLMRATMDRVEYTRNKSGGTTLTMEKRLVAGAGGEQAR